MMHLASFTSLDKRTRISVAQCVKICLIIKILEVLEKDLNSPALSLVILSQWVCGVLQEAVCFRCSRILTVKELWEVLP